MAKCYCYNDLKPINRFSLFFRVLSHLGEEVRRVEMAAFAREGLIPDPNYRKVSNIRRTKSQNSNASRLILQLSLPNPLKPGVKLRMKM